MLGFLALGFTCYLIFTLVRNALHGVQLSAKDSFQGPIELIIPVMTQSDFYLEAWMRSLNSFKKLQENNLRIHILVDGHHPAISAWQELHQKLPLVEIHNFPMRPLDASAGPWMLQQLAGHIRGQVVIISDPELVPSEEGLLSVAHHVSLNDHPLLVLPQTARLDFLGEALAALNPTLALTSCHRFKKYGRQFAHPLLSLVQGQIGMPLKIFQELQFNTMTAATWKMALAYAWDRKNQKVSLAFGEKYLKRYYPENLTLHMQQLQKQWEQMWKTAERTGLWLYLVALFIWSFPLLCFWTHPFWSMAAIGLLVIYRFFTKIVFQERWMALILHPVAIVLWISSLFWWGIRTLKKRSQGPAI